MPFQCSSKRQLYPTLVMKPSINAAETWKGKGHFHPINQHTSLVEKITELPTAKSNEGVFHVGFYNSHEMFLQTVKTFQVRKSYEQSKTMDYINRLFFLL